jgi:hypothetical protein
MFWLQFVLLAILGVAVFVPLAGNGRLVAMIVFVVLMVLWLVLGGGFVGELGLGHR